MGKKVAVISLNTSNNNPVKRSFFVFKKLLIFTGKPFYFIVVRSIVSLLFIFYITGYITKTIILFFIKYIVKFYVQIIRLTSTNITAIRTLLSKRGYRKVKKIYLSKRLTLSYLKLKLKVISKLKIYLPRKRAIKGPSVIFKYLLISFLFFSVFIPTVFYLAIVRGLPSPEDLTKREIQVSTKIYDRNGILLYNIYKDKNRSVVTLTDVPDVVKYATLAAEDAEFYSHPGFSIRGISRALIKNITEGKSTGGSTITQQLVKNALLTSEKTLVRKIKELYLSMNVERVFTKDEILEMYLNEVSYGGTAYGIQEASRTYFDKDIDKLTLAEAALLAGLPKSPTKFSPHGTNGDVSLVRQKEVLHLMKINGYITEEQEHKATSDGIKFALHKTDIKAPHFVMYVREFLEEKYGRELVEAGGLTVTTTLDYQMQMLAEKIVVEEVEKLKGLNVTNGSVIIVNPQSGEILAMVGSKDYFDIENDGNVNVSLRERQPGSSIKVVNYAYALSHGYTPLTVIDDSPITYKFPGSSAYTPKNYDGAYLGKITLRNALAHSRNIPAVKVLASFGVDKMIDLGKNMGITTWENPERFGLSLTLGGGETKLIDLAIVYSTLANYGVKPEITPLIAVTDHKGNVYYENECRGTSEDNTIRNAERSGVTEVMAAENELAITKIAHNCNGTQVLDPRVAFMITDILTDNVARTPQFGSISALLVTDHPEVAVKTGTSNNLRDNLTIGYNQNYVVAVWVGNNDNSAMARIASGVTGASPIFNKVMTQLLTFSNSNEWEVPQGLAKVSVCPTTGTLACVGCSSRSEWFFTENVPTNRCSDGQNEHIGQSSNTAETN